MVACLHLPTNVPPWSDAEVLTAVDEELEHARSEPLDLAVDSWCEFGIRKDGEHLTAAGFKRFTSHLTRALQRKAHDITTLLIVSDSTIETEEHARRLQCWLSKRLGCVVTVDFVCGSGFVAGCDDRFANRVSRHDVRAYSHVLFMGGWNDRGCCGSLRSVRRHVRLAVRGVWHPR